MGGVGGVLLDDSVLFADGIGIGNGNGAPTLRPGAEFLFRALQCSQIRKGICFGDDLSTDKVNLLKKVSKVYSFDCFSLSSSPVEVVMNEIAVTRSDAGLRTVYVISSDGKSLFDKLCNNDLLLTVIDDDDGGETNEHPNIHYIKKLEELPLHICRLHKKMAGDDVATVAYSMRLARQVDFAKRGAFPLFCAEYELMFLPLTYELSIPLQLQDVDVILHKATDDIVSIDLDTSPLDPKITYTNGMEELKRTLEEHLSCCVIDPFNNIYPVLDRLKIQHVLLGLENLNKEGHSKMRGPYFLKVDDLNDTDLILRLLEAKLCFPSIVKPQVACGVSNAHSMAIVFRPEDFKDLPVPLPAIVQEYVDHSSTLFKCYVLGEELFYAVKKSIPNADLLMKLSEANKLKPLLFDSLKSLPAADKNQLGDEALDLELVKTAADYLRRKLQLTIFGFDVVIEEGTGDHVIVDVNYLPSFKEVPDDIALPAFWKAIRNKFLEKKTENK